MKDALVPQLDGQFGGLILPQLIGVNRKDTVGPTGGEQGGMVVAQALTGRSRDPIQEVWRGRRAAVRCRAPHALPIKPPVMLGDQGAHVAHQGVSVPDVGRLGGLRPGRTVGGEVVNVQGLSVPLPEDDAALGTSREVQPLDEGAAGVRLDDDPGETDLSIVRRNGGEVGQPGKADMGVGRGQLGKAPGVKSAASVVGGRCLSLYRNGEIFCVAAVRPSQGCAVVMTTTRKESGRRENNVSPVLAECGLLPTWQALFSAQNAAGRR